jgi:hypothetical protein
LRVGFVTQSFYYNDGFHDQGRRALAHGS